MVDDEEGVGGGGGAGDVCVSVCVCAVGAIAGMHVHSSACLYR